MNLEPTQYIPSRHTEVLSLPPSEYEPKEEKTGTTVQLSILYIFILATMILETHFGGDNKIKISFFEMSTLLIISCTLNVVLSKLDSCTVVHFNILIKLVSLFISNALAVA